MTVRLQQRPFRFQLRQPLQTAAGVLRERRGWLLRLEDENGLLGWGEVAPLAADQLAPCEARLERLPQDVSRPQLEAELSGCPAALAFGLGAALAELDGLVGSPSEPWRQSPPPAWLLPSGQRMLEVLNSVLAQHGSPAPLTFKWKVAAAGDAVEQRLLEQLLERLPANGRLRLDANGGWDYATARRWMMSLAPDPRFAWLEQPLPVVDQRVSRPWLGWGRWRWMSPWSTTRPCVRPGGGGRCGALPRRETPDRCFGSCRRSSRGGC